MPEAQAPGGITPPLLYSVDLGEVGDDWDWKAGAAAYDPTSKFTASYDPTDFTTARRVGGTGLQMAFTNGGGVQKAVVLTRSFTIGEDVLPLFLCPGLAAYARATTTVLGGANQTSWDLQIATGPNTDDRSRLKVWYNAVNRVVENELYRVGASSSNTAIIDAIYTGDCFYRFNRGVNAQQVFASQAAGTTVVQPANIAQDFIAWTRDTTINLRLQFIVPAGGDLSVTISELGFTVPWKTQPL